MVYFLFNKFSNSMGQNPCYFSFFIIWSLV